jgi:hypothetical protein
MRCPRHVGEFVGSGDILLHILEHQIILEEAMTQFANDQAHLDVNVQAVSDALTAFKTQTALALSELKQQIAAGVPAPELNFSAFDSIIPALQADVDAATAEATADVPPVVTPPADGSTPPVDGSGDTTTPPVDGSTPPVTDDGSTPTV